MFEEAYLRGILGESNWRTYPECSYVEYIWGGMGEHKAKTLRNLPHDEFYTWSMEAITRLAKSGDYQKTMIQIERLELWQQRGAIEYMGETKRFGDAKDEIRRMA